MILTQIFYDVDNFCKDFKKHLDAHMINANVSALLKRKSANMTLSDIMTVLVYRGYAQVGKNIEFKS